MCNVKVLHSYSNSDHCQIEFSAFTDSTLKRDVDLSVTRYDWNKADFNGISDYSEDSFIFFFFSLISIFFL